MTNKLKLNAVSLTFFTGMFSVSLTSCYFHTFYEPFSFSAKDSVPVTYSSQPQQPEIESQNHTNSESSCSPTNSSNHSSHQSSNNSSDDDEDSER